MQNTEIYQSEDLIYIPQGAELPCRCVRCNAVVEGEPKSRTFRYVTGTDKRGRAVYPNEKVGIRSVWMHLLATVLIAEVLLLGVNDKLLGVVFLTFVIAIPLAFRAVKLSPSLCKKHNTIRKILMYANYTLLIFGVFQIFASLFFYKTVAYPFFTVGMVMVGIAFVLDMAFSRHINILNVLYETNDNEIVVDGVGEEFRNSFREKNRINKYMS